MPIYEFKCLSCGKVFEHLCFRRDEEPAACPICSNKNAQKLLSTFSSIGSSPSQSMGASSSGHSCASHGGFS